MPRSDAVFLYPSDPAFIANTIESSVSQLRVRCSDKIWKTWKDFGISGQIVFCQICKALRFSKLVVGVVP